MKDAVLTITTNLPVTAADAALTESRALRAQHINHTDVLAKVKAYTLLPDDIHATTEIVADYFDVDAETIKKLVQRNRAELETNGYRVVRGQDLNEFAGDGMSLSKVRALALFDRHAMLNVAMLLTGSEVAKTVRRYLIKLEGQATPEAKAAAVAAVTTPATPVIERAHVAQAHLAVLAAAKSTGLLDDEWLASKTYLAVARGLSEEPEIPAELHPIYVPDFLASKGMTKKEITSKQSWFGRRVGELAKDRGIEVPRPRYADLVSGQVRETVAWKRRHMDLFEDVWNQYYAAEFDRPMALELPAA